MQVTAPANLVPVRNAQPGPTVFRDPPNDVTIRWEGSGDPRRQDWQYVPETYRNHSQFADMLRKGVLVIETDDSAVAAASTPVAPSAGASLEEQAAAAFHRPEVNDFIQKACVGPGAREGAACGIGVPVRQSDLATIPPLCDTHKPLQASFVPIAGVGEGGVQETKWAMVNVAQPQTEAAQTGPTPTAPVG